MKLDAKSIARLTGVHPDLAAIAQRAATLTPVEFVITEGMRTVERQRQLVAAKASKTMRSRHLTGHAIDVAAKVGGKISWDWPLYARIAKAFKAAAKDLGMTVEWGGDWITFKDGPHFQLPFKRYPEKVS